VRKCTCLSGFASTTRAERGAVRRWPRVPFAHEKARVRRPGGERPISPVGAPSRYATRLGSRMAGGGYQALLELAPDLSQADTHALECVLDGIRSRNG